MSILTDQERQFREGELPPDLSLPAHERLRRQGTTFVNHTINSCVCTPSRSVIYTGQHIEHTRMFDNTNFPWIQSMSPDIPTVGDMLREAGYTAYKGKCTSRRNSRPSTSCIRQHASSRPRWRLISVS